MIRTQMNADFQDSIKQEMLFGVHLRKSASHETKRSDLRPEFVGAVREPPLG